MDYLTRYKGHYIEELQNVRTGEVLFQTTLPESALPDAVRVRGGFRTMASAKKYITRFGRPIKIRRVK